jgi:hypothetical protein
VNILGKLGLDTMTAGIVVDKIKTSSKADRRATSISQCVLMDKPPNVVTMACSFCG